jgi:hypothetical protein
MPANFSQKKLSVKGTFNYFIDKFGQMVIDYDFPLPDILGLYKNRY